MNTKLINASIAASIIMAAALPALAQTTPSTTPTPTSAPKTLNLACMQSAVGKRDSALGAGVDAYSASWKSALQTRADAVKAAWGVTDRKTRRAALSAAWKAFNNAFRQAKKDHRASVRNAWAQFKTDSKACGPQQTDEPGGESQDAL